MRRASAASAYLQLQRRGHKLMLNLHKEIRDRTAELARLQGEASRLAHFFGRGAPKLGAVPTGRVRAARKRIDWQKVLGQLPKRFKAADIRKIRGLREKRASELFAAVTRWKGAGLVKRKERGSYEKT
jgi:hypothetical protein